MAKKIIKEIIIFLLICLAILLALIALLYNFIPSNKVIPASITYQSSEEIQEQVGEAQQEEQTEIILRYEVTSTDLTNYERTNSYNAGKVNPFASYHTETEEESANDEATGSSNTTNKNTTTNNTTSKNTVTNNTTNQNSTKNNTTSTENSSSSNSTTTGKYFETTPGGK